MCTQDCAEKDWTKDSICSLNCFKMGFSVIGAYLISMNYRTYIPVIGFGILGHGREDCRFSESRYIWCMNLCTGFHISLYLWWNSSLVFCVCPRIRAWNLWLKELREGGLGSSCARDLGRAQGLRVGAGLGDPRVSITAVDYILARDVKAQAEKKNPLQTFGI